jgi:hypothetical protein
MKSQANSTPMWEEYPFLRVYLMGASSLGGGSLSGAFFTPKEQRRGSIVGDLL